jgi:hypothetical protein
VFFVFLRFALPELRNLRRRLPRRPTWLMLGALIPGSRRNSIMVAMVRLVAVASLVVFAAAGPASAWWRYAEWGMSEGQIMAASGGQAVPCREGVPVCARTPTGAAPRLFLESVEAVGLPLPFRSFSMPAGN